MLWVGKFLLVFFLSFSALTAAVLLYMSVAPAVGGLPSESDREDYARRAHNYRNGIFVNEEEHPLFQRTDETDEGRISKESSVPRRSLPVETPNFESVGAEEVQVVWLGHSTLFISMHGKNLLVDPIFSKTASPVPFFGARRFSEFPARISELPPIDLVLITHDHYDHLDRRTIRKLDAKVKRYVVSLGVEKHLQRWQVDSSKIHNMAWWEEFSEEGLLIACTPAQHNSRRGLRGGNQTLWASYVLKDEHHQLYLTGDTGFGGHFQEIRERYGAPDLAMTDGAQYDKRWKYNHMFPEEAIRAMKLLGAKLVMPIHWGAYRLSRHGWDDPPERFVRVGEREGLKILTPRPGGSVSLNVPEKSEERWWRAFRTTTVASSPLP